MKDPFGEALSALRRVRAGDPEWPGVVPDCVRLPAKWWTDGGSVLGAAWNAAWFGELDKPTSTAREPSCSLRLPRARVEQLHATLQRFLPDVEAAAAEQRLRGDNRLPGIDVLMPGMPVLRWCHEFLSLAALTAVAAADPLRTLYLVYERGVDVLLMGTVEGAP